VAHGMGGLAMEAQGPTWGFPTDAIAMVANGKRGPKENLPTNLQEKRDQTA